MTPEKKNIVNKIKITTVGFPYSVFLISILIIIILYSNIQIQSTRVFEKEDHEVIPMGLHGFMGF